MIAALLIQTTLADVIAIRHIKPDFPLIVLVWISFSQGQLSGTVFGFIAGWLQDIYSPTHLGLNALCKTLTGFGVGYFSQGAVVDNLLVQGIILFLATLLHDVLYFLILAWGQFLDVPWYLLSHSLPVALYTTVVGLLMLTLLVTGKNRERRLR